MPSFPLTNKLLFGKGKMSMVLPSLYRCNPQKKESRVAVLFLHPTRAILEPKPLQTRINTLFNSTVSDTNKH